MNSPDSLNENFKVQNTDSTSLYSVFLYCTAGNCEGVETVVGWEAAFRRVRELKAAGYSLSYFKKRS